MYRLYKIYGLYSNKIIKAAIEKKTCEKKKKNNHFPFTPQNKNKNKKLNTTKKN